MLKINQVIYINKFPTIMNSQIPNMIVEVASIGQKTKRI